ncbi:hypothetical protein D0Z03_000163 [Geotrichum reessii]|nr:hypothetical protein D0Z03_000163 [Galactomyces reessii]
MSTHRARPTSEIFFQHPLKTHQPDTSAVDHVDKVTEKWLADLGIYQQTLEEMASINLDQEFKDELNAVQQWFEVLSEGERTAALYALLQDSSQVQVRFFITVLKRMAQNDTIAGVLSPTTATSASSGLSTGISSYDLYSRQPQSPRFNASSNNNSSTPKSDSSGPSNLTGSPVPKTSSFKNVHRHSPSINSNRSSSIITPQYITQDQPSISSIASLISPNIESSLLNGPGLSSSPFLEKLPSNLTPWVQSEDVINRPKSADVALSATAAHANLSSSPIYYKPPPSIGAGIKRYTSTPPPPGINISNAATQPLIPSSSAVSQDEGQLQQPNISSTQFIYPPEFQGASWASMSNTPTAAIFSPIPTTFTANAATNSSTMPASSTANSGPGGNKINAEIASATAMKMAALSTVNNRVILDHDVKKFRRNKSVAPLDLDGSSGKGGNTSSVNSPILSDFGHQGKVINQQLMYPSVSSPLVDRAQYLNNYSMALLSPVPPPQPYEYGNGRANGHKKQQGFSKKPNHQNVSGGSSTSSSSISNPQSTLAAAGVGTAANVNNGPVLFDLELLSDVPQWLKTLRLHKYTDQLKDLTWRDLVALTDAQLEARGVNALGARRKMLKVFEQVREADTQGNIK